MINSEMITQIKFLLLALALSFVLVSCFESTVQQNSIVFNAQNTFLGLNLFLEILIYFSFIAFVVFGVKGFFENYSLKFTNLITLLSGIVLVFAFFLLSYQVFFQD